MHPIRVFQLCPVHAHLEATIVNKSGSLLAKHWCHVMSLVVEPHRVGTVAASVNTPSECQAHDDQRDDKRNKFSLLYVSVSTPRTDRQVPFVQTNIVKNINLIYSDGPPRYLIHIIFHAFYLTLAVLHDHHLMQNNRKHTFIAWEKGFLMLTLETRSEGRGGGSTRQEAQE